MTLGLTRHPEEMSRRAQKYLVAVANRHAILAVLFIGFPRFFTSDVYVHIRDLLPFAQLWIWGVACGGVAVTNWIAAHTREEPWAARGLLAAYVLTLMMAAAYIVTWAFDGLAAPVISVTLVYVARKDFIQLGEPLRAPFDPVVAAYAGDGEPTGWVKAVKRWRWRLIRQS